VTTNKKQSTTEYRLEAAQERADEVGKRKNLGWVWSEGGVEAGPLQRDVDELLVREAGAQSASSAAAAHCSSEVVRLGMREQGDGAGTGREGRR